MKRFFLLLFFVTRALPGFTNTFGSDSNTFNIEFVPIGDPNNPADIEEFPFNAGSVPYAYRIGKFEISEQMIDKANALGNLGITHDNRSADQPATSLSWFEAARFVNWLNICKDIAPAYKFDANGDFQLWEEGDLGYNPANLFRNSLARYVLPNTDEWYKAAYYDPTGGVYFDYPTGSDTVPDGIDFVGDPDFEAVFFDGAANPEPNDIANVGLLSPYGIAGQGGNVFEWDETAIDRLNDVADKHRRVRGGSWVTASNVLLASHGGGGITPNFQGDFIGFRVVYIPEPSTLLLLGIGLLGFASRFRTQGICIRIRS